MKLRQSHAQILAGFLAGRISIFEGVIFIQGWYKRKHEQLL
jgi:hypothetical protein